MNNLTGTTLTYRVKVLKRPEANPVYLWGGMGVLKEFDKHLFLFFRVDDNGEEISFGSNRFAGIGDDKPTFEAFGKLGPSESFVVDLKGLKGIYANCEYDTFVMCTLLPCEG